jgi:peptidoglycan LD-endopeptidase LytH
MSEWRQTAKTISTTFLVTSAAWVIAGAVLFEQMRRVPAAQSGAGASHSIANKVSAKAPASLRAATLPKPDVPRLVVPVAGIGREQLVDTFTQAREGGTRVHNAIDIMASLGTPVLAAAAGQVEKLFVSARGGNTLYIRSPDRTLIYYYAHLDAYAPGLAEKQAVRQGEKLGTVGFSGSATPDAPHLHFEVQQTTPEAGWWQSKVSLNPYPLLMRR